MYIYRSVYIYVYIYIGLTLNPNSPNTSSPLANTCCRRWRCPIVEMRCTSRMEVMKRQVNINTYLRAAKDSYT